MLAAPVAIHPARRRPRSSSSFGKHRTAEAAARLAVLIGDGDEDLAYVVASITGGFVIEVVDQETGRVIDWF